MSLPFQPPFPGRLEFSGSARESVDLVPLIVPYKHRARDAIVRDFDNFTMKCAEDGIRHYPFLSKDEFLHSR